MKYQDHLNRRGHDPKTVHDTLEKKTTEVVFSTNPRRPNVTKIIKENFYLLQNNEILKEFFPENSILVANKRRII